MRRHPARRPTQRRRQTTDDPLAASGKLQKVEAFGNVTVRTVTDTAIGDRAVYVPETGIARLAGHVRITRGENQLDGSEAEVNMKTGIRATAVRRAGDRVQGLVLPNDATNQQLGGQAPPATAEMNDSACRTTADRGLRVLSRAVPGWWHAASARPTRSARWCGT